VPERQLKDTKAWLRTARVISEALPYMRRYAGQTFVVKYGGHAMGNQELAQLFARDIVLLKQIGINPIVVHGGGPQIAQMLERLAVKSEFVDGLRVTDQQTVEIVEMVLAGRINKQIVTAINEAGGTAIGISGKDGRLIQASKLRRTQRDPDSNIEKILDLGFVGEPKTIDPHILAGLEHSGMIPVIAPIGVGNNGETYNINADTAAGAIAAAVGASRLLLLTDIAGVMDREQNILTDLDLVQIKQLREDGIVYGGMIPKLETCVYAVENGVDAAVILDGRMPHSILLEIFTEHGHGTLVRREPIGDATVR